MSLAIDLLRDSNALIASSSSSVSCDSTCSVGLTVLRAGGLHETVLFSSSDESAGKANSPELDWMLVVCVSKVGECTAGEAIRAFTRSGNVAYFTLCMLLSGVTSVS